MGSIPTGTRLFASNTFNTNLITSKNAVKELVNIDEKYIQYVKAERDDNLIKCNMHPFVQAVHMAYSHHVPLTRAVYLVHKILQVQVQVQVHAPKIYQVQVQVRVLTKNLKYKYKYK